MSNSQPIFFSKQRVETFSDGIFAIIITLLVLEIKVPHIADHSSWAELSNALILLLPKIISWVISFLIVCVIWVNHHQLFEQMKYISHPLFWLNANLLLWCSFIPFPTALIGDYSSNPVALATFGAVLAMMSLSFSLIRFHMSKNPSLIREGIDLSTFKVMLTKSLLFGPMMYMLGIGLGFVHTYLALALYLFIPLYFILFSSHSGNTIQESGS